MTTSSKPLFFNASTITSRIFSDSERIRELLFYLFSRQALWSVWLGFAIGTSARISFQRKEHRYVFNQDVGEDEKQDSVGDESN